MSCYSDMAAHSLSQETLSSMIERDEAAYIEIGEGGRVQIVVTWRFGVPRSAPRDDVDHRRGRTMSYEVRPQTDLKALRASLLVGGPAHALIGRIIAGHTTDDVRGCLDDDAQAAASELEALLEALPKSGLTVWSARAWLCLRVHGLSFTSSAAEVEAAADEVMAKLDGGHVIRGGREAVLAIFYDLISNRFDGPVEGEIPF